MRSLVCGNWKMNKTVAQTMTYLDALRARERGLPVGVDVAIAPPFTALAAAAAGLARSKVKLGAQNVHWARTGAFTGEISAEMLVELGVSYVIVGHSERRQYFGDTDETVNKRAHAALSGGLTPIVCVGETPAERQAGATNERVTVQTRAALAGMSEAEVSRVVVAYEPLWAIGTGNNCDAAEADATMAVIRGSVSGLKAVRILYGGSVSVENVGAYAVMPNINGALVGGASLDVDVFCALIAAAHTGTRA